MSRKRSIYKTHDSFLCLFCYYRAASERVLDLHYRLTHRVFRDRSKVVTLDVPFCENCKTYFSNKDDLLHHAKNCRCSV